MGCGRQQLQRAPDDIRQAAQRLQPRLVGGKLDRRRQPAMDKQMGDLLEFAGLGDIEDIVAAIMQVVAGAADRAQRGVAGDDPGKGDGFLRLGQCHGFLLRLQAVQSKMPLAAAGPRVSGATSKFRRVRSPAGSSVKLSTAAMKRSCSAGATTPSASVRNLWM